MKAADRWRGSPPLSEPLPGPAAVLVLLATSGVSWTCRLVVRRLLPELVDGWEVVADTNEALVSLTLVVPVSVGSVALVEGAPPAGVVRVGVSSWVALTPGAEVVMEAFRLSCDQWVEFSVVIKVVEFGGVVDESLNSLSKSVTFVESGVVAEMLRFRSPGSSEVVTTFTSSSSSSASLFPSSSLSVDMEPDVIPPL